MIKHPNYSTATKKNDIALLRLTRRIIFAPNIRPACLEMELRDHLRHVELNVTGWGTTSAERMFDFSIHRQYSFFELLFCE